MFIFLSKKNKPSVITVSRKTKDNVVYQSMTKERVISERILDEVLSKYKGDIKIKTQSRGIDYTNIFNACNRR